MPKTIWPVAGAEVTETQIGIAGAGGRMGRALAAEIRSNASLKLIGGIDRPGAPAVGHDLGEIAGLGHLGVTIGDDPARLFTEAEVVIDFSAPAACPVHADLAAQAKTAYVVGTTGLKDRHFAALKAAAKHTAIVQAYNMSLGVALIASLVANLARTLDPSYDIEILEMHHRAKADAPSGTAILFGEAAAKGRGVLLNDVAVHQRHGLIGPRKPGQIGFASLRGGNVVGEHAVIFAADDELIELKHQATNRAIFARGAVRAALWAAKHKPGLYGMADVLGIER
jgi:4-hydroxy-tetrahydrodipicolinate reductase